jgi:Ca2+-binding EF-hand superfamily protein
MGWFWVFPGRNGLISNPWLKVGDKGFFDIGKGHLEDITVINMHRDGTIDICFISNGHVMKNISRYDCKGLEHGRLLRLIFFIWNNFWDGVFFLQRRIPCWPCTMNKTSYLNALYGSKSLYKVEVKDCFKELGITKSSDKMRWLELWANIDMDESNGMSMDEFCNYFDLTKGTPIVERTFEIFNTSCTGEVTFIEFMHGVWDMCNFDEERSKRFWFRIMQKSGQPFNGTSVLDLRDITRVLRIFYGQYNNDVHAAMVNAIADDDASGGITFEEFLDFSKAHQVLLYPGYWMQMKLRAAMFGKKYWAKATDKRKHMYRRNKALELVMKQFEERGNKKLVNGRRNFELDFHWEGKKPNVTTKFQIVPVDSDLKIPQIAYEAHVHKNGFF